MTSWRSATKVALVVDDLASVRPWSSRYVRVYGTAEIVERQTRFGLVPVMKITPLISWGMNLTGQWRPDGAGITPHKTIHRPAAPDAPPGDSNE